MSKDIKQLKAEHNEFLLAYAHAILSWQHVEKTLFQIFALVIRSTQYNALSASFHSIINTNARLDVVDAALRSVFNDGSDEIKEWTPLRKRIRKHAGRRNAMAHGMLTMHTDSSPFPASVPPDTTYLRRSFQDALASTDEEFDLKKIKESQELFTMLTMDLIEFTNKLWAKFGHDFVNLSNKKSVGK